MIKVKRALISVSDKKGILPFAKRLHSFGVEILSTGGTARQLRDAGIPVIEVSDYTGFPEMLDGRVKTLHPKIHGGLLALRNKKEHMDQIAEHSIGLIDMAVVNLYPFESVIKKKKVSMEEAIENIDIGGPSMLRSAAKNYKSVAVVCNPEKYGEILKELDVNSGILSDFFLFRLSVEAFKCTARYDQIIFGFLTERLSGDLAPLPKTLDLNLTKAFDLRYGENPHQNGALYRQGGQDCGLTNIRQLHGKELSFNNFLDLSAAVNFIKDFDKPTAVIIKHNNPTGIAEDTTLLNAFKNALKCDPISAFGGIIGFNKAVDVKTAKEIFKSGFMECVISPKFNKDALEVLKVKKNLRLIEFDFNKQVSDKFDYKKVCGGFLVQEKDNRALNANELKVVTKKKPTKAQMDSMLFGWKVIKNVKSNAIVLVKGKKTIGIGCGQTSRIESVRISIKQAGKEAKGSVLISDAFLPKTDNIKAAAKAGIKAIIHPGGSIADADVIKEADKVNIAMVATGVRHFKH
ncbi:MAG: bifunctional phosphoribosylaminoimidazolecarboxamide formyltransferase/IMP cyclohydrolase [Candidatus Zapsychrus exili]|nr:bifunctional phosphoribosylaminoimidazolecarboxamide formyltransferase/IMP cyclohydrolase [Candidatus Zapsychrus exili]